MNRWFLVQPPVRAYRAASDDELAAEARRLAARDREAGVVPRDWPREELERRKADLREYQRLMQSYAPARWPEKHLLAPPSWPAQLALMAIATLLLALGDHAEVALAFPVWEAMEPLEKDARRRSAERLGVTAANVPWPAVPATLFPYLAATVATGLRGERPTWPVYLAGRVIGAVNERRSWRRAYRG